MTRFDPRLYPYRDDLAAESLRGRVEATAYAEGRPMQVAAGYADLRRRPDDGAPLDSQLLFGEEVLVFRGMPDTRENTAFRQDKTFWYLTGVESPIDFGLHTVRSERDNL